MVIQNVDVIFALNIGMCIISFLFILGMLIRSWGHLDADTKILFIIQLVFCAAYIILEHRWIAMYMTGEIIIKDVENLYWIIMEASYFAIFSLLSGKLYLLNLQRFIKHDRRTDTDAYKESQA